MKKLILSVFMCCLGFVAYPTTTPPIDVPAKTNAAITIYGWGGIRGNLICPNFCPICTCVTMATADGSDLDLGSEVDFEVYFQNNSLPVYSGTGVFNGYAQPSGVIIDYSPLVYIEEN